MVLDEEARVRYASPNAVSALHRVGISANAVGMRLAELGFNDSPVRLAYEDRMPVIEEFEQTPNVTLLSRCMPILAGGEVTGGVLLLRDVTEVRKRDKLLLSKDATIREIHHRVKNNLQTISSLLRLQGRRLESPRGQGRGLRVGAPDPHHRTGPRDPVARAGRRRRLPRDRPPVAAARRGGPAIARPASSVHRAGRRWATALDDRHAVVGRAHRVVAERSRPRVPGRQQRRRRGGAVEPDRGSPQHQGDQRRSRPRLAFELNKATGLGLSIVRTLVTTELAGSISMRAGMPEDFAAAGLGDQPKGAGTVVDLTVPI